MSTTTAQQPKLTLDSLLELGQGNDVARFVTLTSAAIDQGVDHDGLRTLLVRRLAGLGLLRRAAAFADGFSEQIKTHADFAVLLKGLTDVADDGFVPWSRFGRRFEANMHALRERYPWANQVHETWETEREHLELHVTRQGAFQVFDRRGGWNGGWRPIFGDHTARPSVERMAQRFGGKVLAPFVIDNVGLGYHLPWLHAATAGTFLGASALIYQVEPSYAALAAALHLNDWREQLADKRVRVCCGPDAAEEFERMVDAEKENRPPHMVVCVKPWSPPRGDSIQERVETLAIRDRHRRTALRDSVGAIYAGRDHAWWHRRYTAALNGEGPPLRVLGMTGRFTTVLQYSARDAINAMRANGCQTRLLIERNDHTRLTAYTLLEAAREFEPDLIFVIDHTREDQRDGVIDDVPFVTWIQDRLPNLFSREAASLMGPLDFCIGFNRNELVERFGYPGDRFMACEMGTDPAALFPPGVDHAQVHTTGFIAEDPAFACDVAFASNHSRAYTAIFEDIRRQSDPQLRKTFEAAYDELLRLLNRSELNGGLVLPHFLQRMAQQTGVELTPDRRASLAEEVLRPLVDQMLRHQTLEWAASWAERTGRRLRLYGTGWETHPRFAPYARRFVKHGPELGRAFRGATVNLHMGCNPALHQRVLDGLAAGGFFLIRRNAGDLSEWLKRAVRDIVRERGLRVGDCVRRDDLPESTRELWNTVRSGQGFDPDSPIAVDERLFEQSLIADQLEREILVAPVVWPEFDQVAFGTERELVERLEFFLDNHEQRRAIAAAMRARVLELFAHQRLMRQMLHWLRDTLGKA